ncbi:MAG: DUF2586 family protein [Bacteroidales bacterium]|nr:DUF2586 family protein [Bacteroidales bacterium]
MLPRVKIVFENGLIGATNPIDDGVAGFLCNGVAVADKLDLNTAYLVTKLEDLAPLGITSDVDDANKRIYKAVQEFYSEAPVGTKLWIYVVAAVTTMAEMLDKDGTIGKAFVNATNGAVKFVGVIRSVDSEYEATIVDGLDSDVLAAAAKAQALAEWATENKYAPFFTILPGLSFSGVPATLKDLSEYDYNRVGIVIGDTVASSADASVGLLCGRIASIPVQRSVARVKSGAIAYTALYIGAVAAENGNPEVIHDLGYICPRTFVGKAGYFWSDDKLATSPADDYALIPRRRTIDKASRIAYATLIEELSDEIAPTSEGKIPAAVCKSLETTVESAIVSGMVGELGTDPDDQTDKGVKCYIDPDQVVVATSKVNVHLRVKPFGYLKYIDVYLGFLVE